MHYLENDIDLLDGIPEEVKRQCYEIRELDLQAEKTLADVRNESRYFFNSLHLMSPSEKSRRYQKIKETYRSIREMSAEKVAITEFLELMLEKYQERIAKDVNEFKVELELDTPGITRSIEMDLCATLKQSNPHRRTLNKYVGIGGDTTGTTTDDSGFEEQRYSTSYGRTKLHGVRTNMMDSDYFSDEKRYNVYYSNPKSASHKFPRLSQQTLALSARDLEPKDKRQRQVTKSDKSSVYAGLLNEMSSSGSYSSDSPYFSFPQRSGKSVTSSPTSTTPSSPISSLNVSHNGRAQYNSLPSSISLTGVMPVFASSQESQYGRPVKLTTRVQQMFKDRQFNRGSRMTPASSSTSFPINHEDRNSIDMLDEEEHDEEHSDGDFNSSISENEDEVPMENDAESENQDNNVWCVCQQKSEGDMVACDNKTCPFEWFHYECVGITAPPRGKWYCPECTKNLHQSRSIETR